MNLGELIDRLKQSPPLNDVRISGMYRGTPNRVTSYRGYYEDLGIVPDRREDVQPLNVSGVIRLLEFAIGQEFTGYKGGEFVMSRSTRVWVSEYGSASGLSVYAVEDVSNIVESFTSIITFENSYR